MRPPVTNRPTFTAKRDSFISHYVSPGPPGKRPPAAGRFAARRPARRAAIALRNGTADTTKSSPSPPAAGGEGRGEEGNFARIAPLPSPLPARSSRREGEA